MTDASFDPKAWIALAAPMAGLTIPPKQLDEVALHLGLVARAAAFLREGPEEAFHEEPAPVYTPGAVK